MDRYRRFTENVTKITYNVPLQISIRQQYHSTNVYFLVPESGWGSQTNWTQTKLGWRQTWTTNNIFATCSRRSLESRQGQCKTDWYARVYIQDAQVGVFCLWRMQSQCLSQELKKVRHVFYQAETHVSPSWKRWDTCLTKLKKVIETLATWQ